MINKDTLRAIKEAENSQKLKVYNSTEELFKHWDDELELEGKPINFSSKIKKSFKEAKEGKYKIGNIDKIWE